jgi:hypothetical protein
MLTIESLIALRAVCIDYHSGQDSRGYRLITLLSRGIERRHSMGSHVNFGMTVKWGSFWEEKYGKIL